MSAFDSKWTLPSPSGTAGEAAVQWAKGSQNADRVSALLLFSDRDVEVNERIDINHPMLQKSLVASRMSAFEGKADVAIAGPLFIARE